MTKTKSEAQFLGQEKNNWGKTNQEEILVKYANIKALFKS